MSPNGEKGLKVLFFYMSFLSFIGMIASMFLDVLVIKGSNATVFDIIGLGFDYVSKGTSANGMSLTPFHYSIYVFELLAIIACIGLIVLCFILSANKNGPLLKSTGTALTLDYNYMAAGAAVFLVSLCAANSWTHGSESGLGPNPTGSGSILILVSAGVAVLCCFLQSLIIDPYTKLPVKIINFVSKLVVYFLFLYFFPRLFVFLPNAIGIPEGTEASFNYIAFSTLVSWNSTGEWVDGFRIFSMRAYYLFFLIGSVFVLFKLKNNNNLFFPLVACLGFVATYIFAAEVSMMADFFDKNTLYWLLGICGGMIVLNSTYVIIKKL